MGCTHNSLIRCSGSSSESCCCCCCVVAAPAWVPFFVVIWVAWPGRGVWKTEVWGVVGLLWRRREDGAAVALESGMVRGEVGGEREEEVPKERAPWQSEWAGG